jgi:hypothetical protein
MPGLAGRISTLTKTKILRMLDHAEDPAETLDHAYKRQLEDLPNVKKGIADMWSPRRERLQLQEGDLRQQADELDGQAREAISARREDLARAAAWSRWEIALGEMTRDRPTRSPASGSARRDCSRGPRQRLWNLSRRVRV